MWEQDRQHSMAHCQDFHRSEVILGQRDTAQTHHGYGYGDTDWRSLFLHFVFRVMGLTSYCIR